MIDEPQPGGLIDGHWILDWIIVLLVMIGIVIGGIWLIGKAFSCPYVEDVSSCFPYNMPPWFPIVIVGVMALILFVLFQIGKCIPDKEKIVA